LAEPDPFFDEPECQEDLGGLWEDEVLGEVLRNGGEILDALCQAARGVCAQLVGEVIVGAGARGGIFEIDEDGVGIVVSGEDVAGLEVAMGEGGLDGLGEAEVFFGAVVERVEAMQV